MFDQQHSEALTNARAISLKAEESLCLHMMLNIQEWHRNGSLDTFLAMSFDDLVLFATGRYTEQRELPLG